MKTFVQTIILAVIAWIVAYLFGPLVLAVIELVIILTGLTVFVMIARRSASGGIRDFLTRKGRREFRDQSRLDWAMSQDRAEVAPLILMDKLMDRHRGRTGCPGEVCSHRRRLPLPRRWILARWLLGGNLYCDTCQECVAVNRLSRKY